MCTRPPASHLFLSHLMACRGAWAQHAVPYATLGSAGANDRTLGLRGVGTQSTERCCEVDLCVFPLNLTSPRQE